MTLAPFVLPAPILIPDLAIIRAVFIAVVAAPILKTGWDASGR